MNMRKTREMEHSLWVDQVHRQASFTLKWPFYEQREYQEETKMSI